LRNDVDLSDTKISTTEARCSNFRGPTRGKIEPYQFGGGREPGIHSLWIQDVPGNVTAWMIHPEK